MNKKDFKAPAEGGMLFPMEFAGRTHIKAFLTTSAAGSMGKNSDPVIENRKKICGELGINKIVTVQQGHTKIVSDAKMIKEGETTHGDGIITSGSEILAVTVADCLPVFLCDNKKRIYGVVHSGWKGTGIALTAVRKMRSDYGCDPADIEVIIGPSIGKCCYSVDRERAELFSSEWGSETVSQKDSLYYLDLKKANKILLENEGIKKIYDAEICTCCDTGYFSYRRDGAKDFSLMLALIGYFG